MLQTPARQGIVAFFSAIFKQISLCFFYTPPVFHFPFQHPLIPDSENSFFAVHILIYDQQLPDSRCVFFAQ